MAAPTLPPNGSRILFWQNLNVKPNFVAWSWAHIIHVFNTCLPFFCCLYSFCSFCLIKVGYLYNWWSFVGNRYHPSEHQPWNWWLGGRFVVVGVSSGTFAARKRSNCALAGTSGSVWGVAGAFCWSTFGPTSWSIGIHPPPMSASPHLDVPHLNSPASLNQQISRQSLPSY